MARYIQTTSGSYQNQNIRAILQSIAVDQALSLGHLSTGGCDSDEFLRDGGFRGFGGFFGLGHHRKKPPRGDRRLIAFTLKPEHARLFGMFHW
jgi:hypothetical protein